MRPQAQRPRSMPAVGADWVGRFRVFLVSPVPETFACARYHGTRTTDDAGVIVVVIVVWCSKTPGVDRAQVKPSVRSGERRRPMLTSPVTFTELSSKSGVGGVPAVAQRRAGGFSGTVPSSRAEDGAIMDRIVGLGGWTWASSGGTYPDAEGLQKKRTKLQCLRRTTKESVQRQKNRRPRRRQCSGLAHCQGS
jgi:hypothetical protein